MRTGIKIMILEQLVDEEVFVYHDKFYAKVPPSSSLIIYQLS
jgi:hypothetical protein